MHGGIAAQRMCRQVVLVRIKVLRLDVLGLEPVRPRTVVVDPAALVKGRLDLDERFG